MANEITLCFLDNAPDCVELAELYWLTEDDGSWRYTVKEISEHLGIPPYQIPIKTANIVEAFTVNHRCSTCGNPQIAKSRSDYPRIASSPRGVCSICTDIEKKQREEELALQLKKERDWQNTVWLSTTRIDTDFDYQSMSYLDAFYAFVLIVTSEFNESTGEIILPEAESFFPDSDELRQVVVRLHNEGALLFGKETPLNAFVIDEKSMQSYKYYPARVSWRFARPLFSDSCTSILSELSSVVDSREQHEDYSTSVSNLWWHLGQAEAKRYLDLQLDAYNLSVESGEKLNESIRYSLQHFSIPKLRNLIWRVAKDTAAYAARRDVYKRQAINSIPGSLIRICDRALADNWDIRPYVLKWDEDEAMTTTMLFDRVLRTGVAGFKEMTGESLLDLVNCFPAPKSDNAAS